jgi:hypothetical protein
MATLETANESLTWAKTGLGEATFNGLASLTSIRHHGEVSPAAIRGSDDDEIRKMLQTKRGQPLPQDLIKRRLLDGFSQPASRNDSTDQFASAAGIEGKNKCIIIVGRNASFTGE